MSPRRIAAGRGRWLRVALALAIASACLGAVAYAATRAERAGTVERLQRARFVEVPEQSSTVAEPQFRFHVPSRKRVSSGPIVPPQPGGEQKPTRAFECRLDNGRWQSCTSPYRLGGLEIGEHFLAVRAFTRDDRAGPAASYTWQQVAPPPSSPPAEEQEDQRSFTIEAQGNLDGLYPGDPPRAVPLLIVNPSSDPIEVTSVTIAIAAGDPNCTAENFALTQAGVTPAAPLTVPANGSVSLPEAAAPTIAMLNLPVNQDACQGAAIPLVFSGEAKG